MFLVVKLTPGTDSLALAREPELKLTHIFDLPEYHEHFPIQLNAL